MTLQAAATRPATYINRERGTHVPVTSTLYSLSNDTALGAFSIKQSRNVSYSRADGFHCG
jgi:hypothetical protein